MSWENYTLHSLRRGDPALLALLQRAGIEPDPHLEFTVGLFDGDRLIATGSVFRRTFRCLAVDPDYRGQNLMGQIVTYLSDRLAERGIFDPFVYTKPQNEALFLSLGFHTIAATAQIILLEKDASCFDRYLVSLRRQLSPHGRVGAIVMNANPLTNGHLYLIRQAAAQCDCLSVLVVSEDISLVPASTRYSLVQACTAAIPNVRVALTGPYLISSAVFPTYFLGGQSEAAVRAQAQLDATIFIRIAGALDIRTRFLGEEPFSRTTALYNDTLHNALTPSGIDCRICPRLTGGDGTAISASRVRQLIHDGRLAEIRPLVPAEVYEYLSSDAAAPIVENIRRASTVTHG